MSKLYGTLVGDRGESTRRSNKSIAAAVQSWEGSVTVSIDIIDGEHHVCIQTKDYSGVGGDIAFYGKLEDIIGKTIVVKEGE